MARRIPHARSTKIETEGGISQPPRFALYDFTAVAMTKRGTLGSASLRQMNRDSTAERYLHSEIGYCSPAETPMKTFWPALQRAMQRPTSALHLATKVADCPPWLLAQARHSPPCWVQETANADVDARKTDDARAVACNELFHNHLSIQ